MCEQFATEAGAGELSEATKSQIRQAAHLALRGEQLQARQVRGEPVDGDELIRVTSELRRALAPLLARGTARKPDANPSLADYLAGKAGQAA
ncbi:hypothetical protein [Bradyrhizobium sp. MOS002]|uniref:hypothetical protein n=1 Tax=Bradyrhizobium sp. MOS002 TaxID=2133947 RepID=UPI000D13A055|nr:hypothetical protein [Bradyrhizobium sp. MOS002]PSO30536.1 hypothetical protein C7G41_21305 [Bradyrhizobium sp. MOS002]